ncbi:MAG: hypothetical protein M1818_002497 [Claussenomyces sp. TS43310]|nr:MAG: hypothetical protein M1818_002497 [Claussenomyces sp. TS43310]
MDRECHFERLPPEMLLHIVTELRDLGSLDRLLRASPAVFRLFDTYGRAIIETILSSSAIRKDTCAIIRIVALIRSAALPPQVYDLESFQRLVTNETTLHHCRWEFTPSRFPSDVSASVLRGLLVTNRKIACSTVGCLCYYSDRSKPGRPPHLVNQVFGFRSNWSEPGPKCVPSWQIKLAEMPYPPCVEEQLIFRVFWRLELFRQLRSTVNDSLVSWPEEDVKRLNKIEIVDIHDSISDISDLGDLTPDELDEDLYKGILAHEFFSSALDYAQKNKETISSSTSLQTR